VDVTDDVCEIDEYAGTAEFYDLWARAHWAAGAPSLRRSLGKGLDAAAGPVVDLGAGTGWGTLTIADAAPDVSIVAAEPSRSMRTVLLSRLMDLPDVRSRVTVVPSRFATLDWPHQLSGFVAMGMLGHLTRIERGELWCQLADRLAPGAPAVIQLQTPVRPVAVPLRRHSVVQIGDRLYEGWSAASPIGRRVLRWTVRCVVRHGDRIIEEHTSTHDVRTVSFDDVRTESAAVGLTTTATSDGLLLISRGSRW
jgi:SAM-dependent methyltransferase